MESTSTIQGKFRAEMLATEATAVMANREMLTHCEMSYFN